MSGFQVFPTPLKSHSISEIIDLKISIQNLILKLLDHMQGGSEESFLLPY